MRRLQGLCLREGGQVQIRIGILLYLQNLPTIAGIVRLATTAAAFQVDEVQAHLPRQTQAIQE